MTARTTDRVGDLVVDDGTLNDAVGPVDRWILVDDCRWCKGSVLVLVVSGSAVERLSSRDSHVGVISREATAILKERPDPLDVDRVDLVSWVDGSEIREDLGFASLVDVGNEAFTMVRVEARAYRLVGLEGDARTDLLNELVQEIDRKDGGRPKGKDWERVWDVRDDGRVQVNPRKDGPRKSEGRQ